MSSADSSAPFVKGASLLGFLKYIKELPQAEQLNEKIIALLSPQAAKLIERKVIAVADYPYAVFVEIIRTIDKVMGNGDLSVCLALGEYAASRDVKAYLSTFKREIKPEELFGAIDLIWRSYHINSGQLKVEDTSPDNTIIRIYDFPLMDSAHCKLMEGYFIQGIKQMGWTLIEGIETKCTSKGDPYHEFMGRWSK